jgi:lysophospholipase L1-like esterase
MARRAVRDDLAAADVVVLSVGVNDLLRLRPVPLWRRDLGALLAELTRVTQGEVVLLGMPPMGAFPSLPRPVRVVLGRRAARMDRAGVAVADKYGVHHLPLPVELLVAGGAFADDGFHPSARSHDQLAGMVVAVVRRTRESADAVR